VLVAITVLRDPQQTQSAPAEANAEAAELVDAGCFDPVV
jgi:hypothetical protein